MAAIAVEILGALGGLKDGIMAAASAIKSSAGVLAETAVFGVASQAQKPVRIVFEGLEGLEVLKDFNIDFGSKYMKPFGEVAYWEQIVKKIKENNKEIGYAGALSENLAENIRSVGTQTLQLGFDDTEISNAVKSFADESTNNRLFSDDDLENLGRVNKSLGAGFDKIITYNQQFGGSVKQSYGYVDGLLKRVDKYGLNAKQYIQTMQSNLALMNKYQFNDGIKGLEKATLNAQRYKTELGDIATIAEKAMNPEGALELSAQMSALGGSFAENFGDFYSLIDKSRNGVDGLSDSLKKAFTGLATFNKEKGVFEVNTLNRSIIKAATGNLNISQENGYKIAIAGQKEEEIKKRIRLSQFTNADEAVSKIAGAAEFGKGGTATIKIVGADGKTVNKNVQDVTEKDLSSLSAFKDESKDATQQLIDSNMTNVQALERNTEEIKRLFFSINAYNTGGEVLKGISEKMLNQVKDGTGVGGATKNWITLSGESQMSNAKYLFDSKDLNELMKRSYENIDANSKQNSKYLDEVIKKVFNDNETARTIIKGAATIESASLGFLSVIAQNTNPKVLLGTLLGGISPVAGAVYNTSRMVSQKDVSGVQPTTQQDFTEQRKRIDDFRSSITTTQLSETSIVNHKFDNMTIKVEGDKDNRKHIIIDANNIKDMFSGKFNPNNNGRSKATEPYLKSN